MCHGRISEGQLRFGADVSGKDWMSGSHWFHWWAAAGDFAFLSAAAVGLHCNLQRARLMGLLLISALAVLVLLPATLRIPSGAAHRLASCLCRHVMANVSLCVPLLPQACVKDDALC